MFIFSGILCCYLICGLASMGSMSVVWLLSTIFVFMQGGFLTTGSYILVDFSIPRAECDNSVFVDEILAQ